MNPFLILLILIAAILLWFALRKIFSFIGTFINRTLEDTKNIITQEDKKDE